MKKITLLEANQEGYGLLKEPDAGMLDIERNQHLIKENYKDMFSDNGRIFVNCILQKADTQNRNGRIYPKNILEKEVNNYMKLVKERASLGETDHPDNAVVSLDNPSHLITKIWWEGNTVLGTLELLTSPAYMEKQEIQIMGDKIANLLSKEIKLGISSRGLGSVKKVNGANIVQSDFELVCFDIVSSPSTPGAYLYQETIKLNEQVNKINNSLNNKLKNFLN
jgi:hypothetical protein